MINRFYEDEFVFIEEDLAKSFVHYGYKPSSKHSFMTAIDYKRSMLAYGNQVTLSNQIFS